MYIKPVNCHKVMSVAIFLPMTVSFATVRNTGSLSDKYLDGCVMR